MSNPTFTLIQSSWLGNVCQMHKAPWRFKRSSESQYTPQGYSGYKSGVAGFVVFFANDSFQATSPKQFNPAPIDFHPHDHENLEQYQLQLLARDEDPGRIGREEASTGLEGGTIVIIVLQRLTSNPFTV